MVEFGFDRICVCLSVCNNWSAAGVADSSIRKMKLRQNILHGYVNGYIDYFCLNFCLEYFYFAALSEES